jgi:hypothetical protein
MNIPSATRNTGPGGPFMEIRRLSSLVAVTYCFGTAARESPAAEREGVSVNLELRDVGKPDAASTRCAIACRAAT